VPGPRRKRSGVEGNLEAALAALAAAMGVAHAPWTIIGGVAVIARGVRRMTTDIDAVVGGGEITTAELLRALTSHEFVVRIDDAEAFAEAHLVLLLRHAPTGVDVDLSLGWTDAERDAITTSELLDFGIARVPVARPDALVVLKAIAGRPIDLDDASALLLLHPELDVSDIRRRVVELATLAEVPELVAGYDAVVERARAQAQGATSTDRAPPPKKRRR
jgi:hypothetical protein